MPHLPILAADRSSERLTYLPCFTQRAVTELNAYHFILNWRNVSPYHLWYLSFLRWHNGQCILTSWTPQSHAPFKHWYIFAFACFVAKKLLDNFRPYTVYSAVKHMKCQVLCIMMDSYVMTNYAVTSHVNGMAHSCVSGVHDPTCFQSWLVYV